MSLYLGVNFARYDRAAMPTTKACPRCASRIPGDSKFCPQYGSPQALTCAACGHANAADSRFCITEGFDKPDLQAARELLAQVK